MIGFVLLIVSATPLAEGAEPVPVGMPARIEQIVLPGPLLEVKPLTDRDLPLVLRIVAAYPHGDSHRYDLEYYALEPGTYDLREYLQREDGSAADGLSPLTVEVRSSLPPGQIQPHQLSAGRTPSVGGYRVWLVVGGVLWVLGLLAILFVGRYHKQAQRAAVLHRATLEERLQAAIGAAGEGELEPGDRAELERMVLAYWRRQLSLEDVDASAAMAAMREHEQARAALEQLERWLHDPSGGIPEDLGRLIQLSGTAENVERT